MEPEVERLMGQSNVKQIFKELKASLEREEKQRNQFYAQIHEQQKAEFIRGKVIIHSPVKKRHSDASTYLLRLLADFVDAHELGYVGHEKIMVKLEFDTSSDGSA
ncbi:MAG: hypothetical protein HC880_06575 [Bacteroidia bacterium]|nr:hypothetical protein [Bacteroidia bacterium]